MQTCSAAGVSKTTYACIVQADESPTKRMEGTLHEDREDHIAGKGINSLNHYNLVRKFIPMPQAMKIPEAKAAVEKEWGKLEKIPAWQLTKVRNKGENSQIVDVYSYNVKKGYSYLYMWMT